MRPVTNLKSGFNMSGNLNFDDLKSHVKNGAIDTVLACIVDMQGRLMGKRLVAQFFIESGWEETHCCNKKLRDNTFSH